MVRKSRGQEPAYKRRRTCLCSSEDLEYGLEAPAVSSFQQRPRANLRADSRAGPPLLRGRSKPPAGVERAHPIWRTAILNERPVRDVNPIPPYHATLTQRFTYVEYDTGEKELYDRNNDPTNSPTHTTPPHRRPAWLPVCEP